MNKNQSKTLSRAKKELRLGGPLKVFWIALLLVEHGCGKPNSIQRPSGDVRSKKFDEDTKEGLQKGDRGTGPFNAARKEEETREKEGAEIETETETLRQEAAEFKRQIEENRRKIEKDKRETEEAQRKLESLTKLLRRRVENTVLQHLEEGYTLDYICNMERVRLVFTERELEAMQAEYQGRQERMRIAYDLMRNNASIELICSATRFTPEELEYIKRRYKSPSPPSPSAE
jgi:hypothetical protein